MPLGTPHTTYELSLPAFSGPLDLLLNLIEHQELDITTISLVQVTQQYLEQVNQMEEQRLDHLIDFIAIGARLVLIKSRALLPRIPDTVTGELEEDPAAALIRQLRSYKRFKAAAAWFHQRENQGLRTYLRTAPPPKMEGKLDLSGINLETLQSAMMTAWHRAERMDHSVKLVQPPRFTIGDQIIKLRQAVEGSGEIPFASLLSEKANRVEIAVTFLAVLELIKRREIIAQQKQMFGVITMSAAPADDVSPSPSPA